MLSRVPSLLAGPSAEAKLKLADFGRRAGCSSGRSDHVTVWSTVSVGEEPS